jgi:hypothetical protein
MIKKLVGNYGTTYGSPRIDEGTKERIVIEQVLAKVTKGSRLKVLNTHRSFPYWSHHERPKAIVHCLSARKPQQDKNKA